MNRTAFTNPPHDWTERDWEDLLRRNSLDRIDLVTAWDLILLADLRNSADTLMPLLLGLAAAVNEGSLCLPLEEDSLARRFESFLDPEEARAVAREIVAVVRAGDWDCLIARDPEAYFPLRLVSEGSGDHLYFQKYDSKERSLIADFGALLETPSRTGSSGDAASVLRETLDERPIRRGGKPVELNLQQKIGLALPLFENVTLVSGGPGTGKTSIAVAILRALVRLGVAIDRIRLAAPTGRAANRLSESIRSALATLESPTEEDRLLMNLEGMTLHRLLNFRGGGLPFGRHRHNPIPADLVIVDEVSMVDVCLMADLVAAVRPGARLVLLGDKDQLPSVEAGAVLGNLLPGIRKTCLSEAGARRIENLLGTPLGDSVSIGDSKLADRIAVLDVSYRSEARILDLAGKVNRGDPEVSDELKNSPLPFRWVEDRIEIDWPEGEGEGGFRWIDSASESDPFLWSRVLDSWIDHHFLKSEKGVIPFLGLVNPLIPLSPDKSEERNRHLGKLFEHLGRSRILCLVRKGPYGVEWVNRRIAERMREKIAPRIRRESFPGLPILVLQNDPTLGVFNGDVGVILRTGDRTLRAFFPRGGDFVAIPIPSLPAFEPAYAITVHKSQGSEYDRILMVLPEDPDHRLLSREIVYTGLTRAKSLAVVFGREECLRAAVARKIDRVSARNLWERDGA